MITIYVIRHKKYETVGRVVAESADVAAFAMGWDLKDVEFVSIQCAEHAILSVYEMPNLAKERNESDWEGSVHMGGRL